MLFKVNDFLKTLYNQLGTPVKNYEITAQYCFNAIEKAEKGQHQGIWHKLRFYYEKFRINVSFMIYGYYLRIKSIFNENPNPELQIA